MRERLPLEGVLDHRRATVAAALAVAAVIAWAALAVMSRGTAPDMDTPAWLDGLAALCLAPAAGAWGVAELAAALAMWLVMLVAMMLPTAAPMIQTFADVAARGWRGADHARLVGAFVGGFLLVWAATGIAAVAVQYGLHRGALLGADGAPLPAVAGGLLVLAGVYQWTALKEACLTRCRHPLTFLMTHWREGIGGAWAMGARHGTHCVGCCWALMALMLGGGAMNLAWTAGLGLLMMAEKVLPRGDVIGRLAGLALAVWGLLVLAPLVFPPK